MESAMTAEQKSALAGVVTIDKEVMHGTPCFAHTRVPSALSRNDPPLLTRNDPEILN
jgi:hypothetical protein